MKVDLHMHSVFSDGALTPTQLVARAAGLGYDAAALTDHDTVRGVPEFLDAARRAGLCGIAGVELSCTAFGREIHILGYGVADPHDELRQFRAARVDRMRAILAKLANLGVAIGEADLRAFGTDVPSRYHIARALTEKGYALDVEDAFRRYLREGSPAWVGWSPVAPERAVDVIRTLGGVAVLAHPKRTRLDAAKLDALCARLAAAGLGGIECYYATHTSSDAQKYRALAKRYGLFATNGSDFHREKDSPLHGGAFSDTELEAETVRALGLGALL